MKPNFLRKKSQKDNESKDKVAKDKMPKSKVSKDKATTNKASKGKASKDKIVRGKVVKGKASKDRVFRDKTSKDRVAKEKDFKHKPLEAQPVKGKNSTYKAWRNQSSESKVNRTERPKVGVKNPAGSKNKASKPEVFQYFTLYKPFNTLCQFTKAIEEHRTLSECYDFPPEVYPVGRLDRDSEGLLLLTNDNKLKHQLTDPEFNHWRYYYVQVEGIPTGKALSDLGKGVHLRINQKNHFTKKAKIVLLDQAPTLPDRDPPIRFRKNVPTSWLSIGLTEGKNRQVRRMCATVGFPVLRLVRYQIGKMKMEQTISGKVIKHSHKTIYKQLGVKNG